MNRVGCLAFLILLMLKAISRGQINVIVKNSPDWGDNANPNTKTIIVKNSPDWGDNANPNMKTIIVKNSPDWGDNANPNTKTIIVAMSPDINSAGQSNRNTIVLKSSPDWGDNANPNTKTIIVKNSPDQGDNANPNTKTIIVKNSPDWGDNANPNMKTIIVKSSPDRWDIGSTAMYTVITNAFDISKTLAGKFSADQIMAVLWSEGFLETEDERLKSRSQTQGDIRSSSRQAAATPSFNDTPIKPKSSEYKYKGISGQKYKYDLSNPIDKMKYDMDISAQMKDDLYKGINVKAVMDRDMGQVGGGMEH